jgi:hypothetical protein
MPSRSSFTRTPHMVMLVPTAVAFCILTLSHMQDPSCRVPVDTVILKLKTCHQTLYYEDKIDAHYKTGLGLSDAVSLMLTRNWFVDVFAYDIYPICLARRIISFLDV